MYRNISPENINQESFMPEKTVFFTFLFAAFMLNIAPGPDMLYVIGRSVGQGRKAGIVSSLGVFVGCWICLEAQLLNFKMI